MPSAVQICNLALARLGDEANVSSIDPPEGSAQAEQCAMFYPICLATMFDATYWSFSTRRAPLVQKVDAPISTWKYAYAAPAEYLNIFAVLPEGSSDDTQAIPFELEAWDDGSPVIYTNELNASVRYNAVVTDTSKFSPLFVEALSWLLASALAGPIIKGKEGRQATVDCYKLFGTMYARAVAADMANRQVTIPHTPSFIRARNNALPIPSWLRDR